MAKETDEQKKARLEKLKKQTEAINKELKLQKELEKKKKELSKLKSKSKPKPKPQINIDKFALSETILNEPINAAALTGVRTPISDSERMWVVSWWENRKTLDPNFDPDTWFKSSVHMDNKARSQQIDNFWTGRAEQNNEDFWTGPTMWARENKI